MPVPVIARFMPGPVVPTLKSVIMRGSAIMPSRPSRAWARRNAVQMLAAVLYRPTRSHRSIAVQIIAYRHDTSGRRSSSLLGPIPLKPSLPEDA